MKSQETPSEVVALKEHRCAISPPSSSPHSACGPAAYELGRSIEWFQRRVDGVRPKQRAKQRADELGTGVPVISLQRNESGSRRFGVVPWPSFFSRYRRMAPESRTFYELVREDRPCKLHFDLDVKLPTNPEERKKRCIELERIAEELFEATQRFAMFAFGNDVQYTRNFRLDASSDSKFSQHSICDCDDKCAMFATHADLREFMRCFEHFCVGRGEFPVFADVVDMGIYRGDREFRICGSTKKGQQRWLVPHGGVCDWNDEFLFYDFLVGYHPERRSVGRLLECRPRIAPRMPALKRRGSDWLAGSFFSGDALPPAAGGRGDEDDVHIFERVAREISAATGIDQRGEALIVPPRYLPEHGHCLAYSCDGKYCEIARRCHSNNNVYYVAWLPSKTYYQRCFNVDCARQSATVRGLTENEARTDDGRFTGRGQSRTLDESLWRPINEFLLTMDSESFADAATSSGMTEVETTDAVENRERKRLRAVDGRSSAVGETSAAADDMVRAVMTDLDALFGFDVALNPK